MCEPCGQKCDLCGEFYVHHQAPHKLTGVIMASSCACEYVVTEVDGVQRWMKLGPLDEDGRGQKAMILKLVDR